MPLEAIEGFERFIQFHLQEPNGRQDQKRMTRKQFGNQAGERMQGFGRTITHLGLMLFRSTLQPDGLRQEPGFELLLVLGEQFHGLIMTALRRG